MRSEKVTYPGDTPEEREIETRYREDWREAEELAAVTGADEDREAAYIAYATYRDFADARAAGIALTS